jgi:hypothetical protein
VQTGKNSEYRSQNTRKTREYREDQGIPRKTKEYEEWAFGNGCG